MRVFYSFDDLPRFSHPVVTVGSFDGVHCGHRVLLDRVGHISREISGESVVVTFLPHPRQVLPHGGDVKLLNTIEEKIFLLGEAGMDNLVIVPFDEDFAKTSWSDFIRILVDKIGMKSLMVGYDHRFGHDKEGGYSSLKNMSAQLGFTVEQVPRQQAGEHKVSSTQVRNAIMAGNMSLASELMTRGYIMIADIDDCGRVTVHDAIKLVPPSGRYAVKLAGGTEVCSDMLTISPEGVMHLEKRRNGDPGKDVLIMF